jgi:hypothetical protein
MTEGEGEKIGPKIRETVKDAARAVKARARRGKPLSPRTPGLGEVRPLSPTEKIQQALDARLPQTAEEMWEEAQRRAAKSGTNPRDELAQLREELSQ